MKKNGAGEVTDRESRVLVYQISTMMRPIQFDEEETKSLQDSEARYLRLALSNYHKYFCLLLLLMHCYCTALPCITLPCPALPGPSVTAAVPCPCMVLQGP